MKNFVWTDEAIEYLTELHTAGHSGSVMARLIGDRFEYPLTRNAIIGKCSRLKLCQTQAERTAEYREVRERTPRVRAPRPQNPRVVSIIEYVPPPPPADPVALLDLEPHHCRYIDGEPSEMLFCGRQKQLGSSYCCWHHTLVYNKVPARRDPVESLMWVFRAAER